MKSLRVHSNDQHITCAMQTPGKTKSKTTWPMYIPPLYDCVATTNSSTVIKFADNTVVVRLISDNNETAYMEEIRNLKNWCQRNNLLLNVSKTKELIVDFSTKQERNYQTAVINECPVERVSDTSVFTSRRTCHGPVTSTLW
ncbi:hypothetical protein QTP86_006586 [Hemibagrus guttatus]|nr:hypothetical protein QTP86_006586 [Hemibagrus guttatus]